MLAAGQLLVEPEVVSTAPKVLRERADVRQLRAAVAQEHPWHAESAPPLRVVPTRRTPRVAQVYTARSRNFHRRMTLIVGGFPDRVAVPWAMRSRTRGVDDRPD